ncbi:MAG: ester cyclase [Acidobacteria bacterium]|nr:ester cyclase [Acidobacteriota bacterium]
MPADVKKISRRIFEEVWNNKNIDLVNELMVDDYMHHDPQSPVADGIDSYKQMVLYYLKAFPDLRFTLGDELSEGELVVTRWTATGTHEGDLAGLPRSGKQFSVTGMTMARITNGRVVESWSNWDTLGMMQQLGGSLDATGRAA